MSCNFIELSHPSIQTLKPYQAGKPIEEVQRELGIEHVIKMASNENPFGPSPLAYQAAITVMSQGALYPDASGYILKQALSEHCRVPSTHITLGNGSDNILSLLVQAYGKDKTILVSEFSFDNYILIAQGHGVGAKVAPCKNWGIDVEAMVNTLDDKVGIIFIANPNNPTGTSISHDELTYLLEHTPENVLVVSDEAYHEFVTRPDYPKTQALQHDYPNLMITRTFSKAYGLAGLRVGYSMSNPDISDILNRIRLPFNVSAPALAAATAALSDTEHLQKTIDQNNRGKAYFMAEFDKLGLSYIPSQTNFLTIDMQEDTAELYQQLLKMGIIVRPLHAYKMPNHFRVTIGLDEQNEKVIDSFKTLARK